MGASIDNGIHNGIVTRSGHQWLIIANRVLAVIDLSCSGFDLHWLDLKTAGRDLDFASVSSGGEAVTAVLGQNVQMTFEAISILLPLIREGKVPEA